MAEGCFDYSNTIVPENLPPPAFTPSLQPRNEDLESGFTCSFVDPPKELRTKCPICLYILREPYQATCCGCLFCHHCIERVRTYKKPCPACRNVKFEIFPDRGLRNSLYGFKVWCCHKDKGCAWSGELGYLDKHLNVNPKSEHRLFGCEFVDEECSLCRNFYPRGQIEDHELKKCPQRQYTCEYCNDYTSVFVDVAQNHWLHCPSRPISCPNECGVYPIRKNLEKHLKYDCELRREEEENVATTTYLPREEVQELIERSVKSQLVSTATDILKTLVQEELRKEMSVIGALREELELLKQARAESQRLSLEIQQLKTQTSDNAASVKDINTHLSIVPVTFILDNYQNRLVLGDKGWVSPFFYTSVGGYRMCLLVDVGGDGLARGIYASVFLNFTKGKFDSQLRWPFRGTITIELLNQKDDKIFHSEVIKYHDKTPVATASQVLEDGQMSKPWGKGKFLRHTELVAGGYILNDTLKFKVSKVTLETL